MMRALQLATLLSAFSGCGKAPPPKQATDVAALPHDAAPLSTDGSAMQPAAAGDDLEMVRNDLIQFATYRPPRATLPTLGRKIKVVAPPEAVKAARNGDIHVIDRLDRLLPLLTDPNRAWAAQVMLSAMTGHDSDLVLDYEKESENLL